MIYNLQTARFPALWKNKEVVFIIDYNNGLSIQSCKGNKVITDKHSYNIVHSIRKFHHDNCLTSVSISTAALSSHITYHPLLLQDIIWSKLFSKLRNTSDDGNRKLIMEFADSSKQVSSPPVAAVDIPFTCRL